MQRLKPATLATIFSEVLANLAFMFTEDEAAEPLPDDLWLETSISYRGPFHGVLALRCPVGFASLLAANLLGVEPTREQTSTQAMDAVKELMNILCGQFVTIVHGREPIFDLSIPEVRELPAAPDLSRPDSAEQCALSVEGYRIQLLYTPGAA